MLRQIARLGRAVPSAGGRALAIAVYADSLDEPVHAREAGDEGVACVDDAARALELYCRVWAATGRPWALRWCEGLLDFILAMQDADGRWLNFILDWEGTPNRVGRTSVAGGAFWQARAVLAMARASRVLDDERIGDALGRGLACVREASAVPSDVRVLHMLTALTLLGGVDDRSWRASLSAWSDEVLACRRGDVLMNAPEEDGRPHLWGHIQEGVLAEAGALLGRDDLIEAACRSAELVVAGPVRTGFDLPRVQPYDVASAIDVLDRLARVTGRRGYSTLATDARAWFAGRNPSRGPVYDRAAGRVADGVDGGVVSSNSGAESNVVAAHALFDGVLELVGGPEEAGCAPPSLAGAPH